MLRTSSFPIELPKKLLITFKCNSANSPARLTAKRGFFEIQNFLKGTGVTNWVYKIWEKLKPPFDFTP